MTKSQTDTHRVAVVAGGMGYVGSAIAKQLAADGLQVVVLYHRSPQDAVEKFLAELAGSGHRAYPCNLEDFEEVSKTVAAVEQDQVAGTVANISVQVMNRILRESLVGSRRVVVIT